jgi:two-component system LytT family response regulator
MKIRTLIVDDEPLARQRVRLLLQEEPDVEITGECDNGTDAVRTIEAERPDLLFLDIQMPEMDGFTVLRNVTGELPVVIFATAFDKHAVQAFEAHALDYLLKPFKPARFADAVQRARQQLEERKAGAAGRGLLELLNGRTPPVEQLTRLTIKTSDRVIFVPVDQIDTIEAAGKYAVVHVGKESHILRETMTNLEGKLPASQFFRISRSAIVNVDLIQEVQPMFKGDHVIVLKNGKKLQTSRTLKEIQESMRSL